MHWWLILRAKKSKNTFETFNLLKNGIFDLLKMQKKKKNLLKNVTFNLLIVTFDLLKFDLMIINRRTRSFKKKFKRKHLEKKEKI
jgi:hypothetical protein